MHLTLRLTRATACALLSTALVACASDDDATSRLPWNPDETTVISQAGQASVHSTPTGDGCLVDADTAEQVCIQPQVTCADETTADVVVDADGNTLDVVCIPPDVETVTAIDLADGEIDQSSNGTALVFEGGGVYEGDLAVDGNKVVLYGQGPDEATIDGDLHVTGNNAIVRGVTITGDLKLDYNGAIVVYCRVLGDVYLAKNNTRMSGCEVHGKVYVTGNNTELHGNRIAGGLTTEGSGTTCNDNVGFTDHNTDGAVQDDELGDPIDC